MRPFLGGPGPQACVGALPPHRCLLSLPLPVCRDLAVVEQPEMQE